MSLYGYKKKGRRAPWTTAFPNQVFVDAGKKGAATQKAKRAGQPDKMTRWNRIRSVGKAKHREYSRAARDFIASARKTGETCPVVAVVEELRMATKYGWPVSNRLAEVHHFRGRLGPLLMEKRFWVAMSKQGHRWVHAHPAKARELGFLCAEGEWNKTNDLHREQVAKNSVDPVPASGYNGEVKSATPEKDSQSKGGSATAGLSGVATFQSRQSGRPLID